MPTGRPTKLTEAIQRKICRAIRNGNFRDASAIWAGVTVSTFRKWCARGKRSKTGPYYDFWHALLAAEGKAEINAVAEVLRAGKKDAKHLEWWLERKIPENWGACRDRLKRLEKIVKELQANAGIAANRTASPPPATPAADGNPSLSPPS